jgi:hypothetical protein
VSGDGSGRRRQIEAMFDAEKNASTLEALFRSNR